MPNSTCQYSKVNWSQKAHDFKRTVEYLGYIKQCWVVSSPIIHEKGRYFDCSFCTIYSMNFSISNTNLNEKYQYL